jgi:steroid delta-isomerase
MQQDHPAMVAARASWRCVQAHDEEGWLNLMADDVLIEDPIGVGPTNPTGQGIRGKAAVRDFYRKNIAPASLSIETEESWVAGSESAHVMRLVTSFPNGVKMTVRGVFTYAVNDAGKLTNLRGYWSMADAKVERPGA